MSRYLKAIIAWLMGLSAWGVTAGVDGTYDQVELWGLLAVVGMALGVYLAPNTPPEGQPADPRMSEQDPAATRAPMASGQYANAWKEWADRAGRMKDDPAP